MRTVERDLENLREQGYQIESHRGRSGGIQMVGPPAPSSNIAPASPARSPAAFGRPFVGRSAQMSELRDALARASSGSGGVSLVSGDPGIGKTRTLQELAGFAEASSVQVHWARCPEDRGAPPYWPWSQIIRSIVAGNDDSLLDTVPYPEHLRAIAPGVAIRTVDDDTASTLTPDQVRFQTNAAVSGLLRAAGSASPLLILIEDLHNGDSASLRLIEVLARDLVDVPVLIVSTYRDREFEPGHPLGTLLGNVSALPNFDRLHLTGLGRTEVAELVRDITGARPLARRLSDIFERTAGNPFFVSEVAREPADLSQTSEIGRPLPRNVRDAVGVRLDALSGPTIEYLSVAAVAGRVFDPAVIRLVMSESEQPELLNSLDQALDHQIVESEDEQGLFRFTHDLVRETIVSRIPAGDLMVAHLAVGEALEHHYGDRADDHANELAYHFGEAGELADADRTFNYSLAAGRRALAVSAYYDAYGFLKRAVELLGNDALDDRGGEAHFGLGRSQEAVGVAMGVSHLEAARNLRTAFDYYEESGNTDGVIAIAGRPYAAVLTQALGDLFSRALEFAAPESHDMGRILVAEAYSRWIRDHDLTESLDQLERASAIARAQRDTVLERSAAAVTANVAGMAGAWERARRWAEVALGMHTGVPDPDAEIRCRIWRSNSLMALGQGPAALEAAEEYIAWSGELQNPFARSTALTVGGLACVAVGDWPRIFELSIESTHMRALDIPLLRAVTFASYATGELDSGRGFLEELIKKSLDQGPGHSAMRTYGGFPLEAFDFALRIAGDDSVEDLLDGALQVARTNSQTTQLAEAARVGWTALMAYYSGDNDEIERVYRHLTTLDTLFDTGGFSNARACALLARKLGLEREADAAMQRAISDTRDAGYLPEHALLSAEHAEDLQGRSGQNSRSDRNSVAVLVEQGLAAARSVGFIPVVERLEALSASLGPATPVDLPAGLTGREAEVLTLVAAGRTNGQIAAELVISEYTVMRHVSNIYAKIDASNRADATAFAVRNGLA
jgi:DNA-binding CsgD family transcriptional regulator